MPTLTRKIKLHVVGNNKEEINRVYKFIRDGQYAQYQGLNLLMGQLASKYYECDRQLNNEEFKKIRKGITNSNPLLDNIAFAKGVDTKSLIKKKVDKDFITAIKNGMARGERSVTNYKRTNPLMTNARHLRFKHNYDSYPEFLEHLYADRNVEVYIDWVNKIKFKIVFGAFHKSRELRNVIQNIFEEVYTIQQSSIYINDDREIILNLSLCIPPKTRVLDENICVGVDLGMAVPATCALNNNEYTRKYIGNFDDFIRVRIKMQNQYKRLQKSLKYTQGGHGRKKKLKALEKYKNYESNFVQSYNHKISKEIIDFALKHNAKYINIENLQSLEKKDKNEFVLRNWSYYQLQQYIKYKADLYGIVVRMVNPYHTSQVCSCCHQWHEGDRISQSVFKCSNPGCKSHTIYFDEEHNNEYFNADFNAARNIAMSTDFLEGKVGVEEMKKQHEDYMFKKYGFIYPSEKTDKKSA